MGLVGDVRHLALESASGNEMYIPMRQCGDQPSADLVVRSSLPPSQIASAIRATLQPLAANLPGNDFRTLQQIVDRSVSPRRFLVLLLGGFAAFALVLASLGIYGLISYSVNQRSASSGSVVRGLRNQCFPSPPITPSSRRRRSSNGVWRRSSPSWATSPTHPPASAGDTRSGGRSRNAAVPT